MSGRFYSFGEGLRREISFITREPFVFIIVNDAGL